MLLISKQFANNVFLLDDLNLFLTVDFYRATEIRQAAPNYIQTLFAPTSGSEVKKPTPKRRYYLLR